MNADERKVKTHTNGLTLVSSVPLRVFGGFLGNKIYRVWCECDEQEPGEAKK